MNGKTKDFPAKNSKKRPFTFQVNINRLSKKSRAIRVCEDSLIIDLKLLPSLKMPHRGYLVFDSIIYDNMNYLVKFNEVYHSLVNLVDMFGSEFGNTEFKTRYWSSDSSTLRYVYDQMSVTGSPDYSSTMTDKVCETSVDTLYGMFKEYMVSSGTQRISEKKYRATCQWLVVYLHHLLRYKSVGVKYTRMTNFKSVANVQNLDFSIPVCMDLIAMLEDLGLLIDLTGNKMFGSKHISMFIPAPELFRMLQIDGGYLITTKPKEIIKVVDDCGNVLKNVDMSDEFANVYNESSYILNGHRDMMEKFELAISNHQMPPLWLQRTLRPDKYINSRLFDDGTFQGKSKLIRSLITIGGQATVSLDFKAIHPSMLLEMEGYSILEHDPYPAISSIKVDVKLINKFKKYHGINKYNPVRNIIKKLVLCLINADNINEAVGSCYEDLSRDSLKRGTSRENTMRYVGLPAINLHEIAGVLIKHNYMISKYFGVGIGNSLQYKDSCVMMGVLEVLTKSKIPCIPIHDAIICRKSDADQVKCVMTESFLNVMGSNSLRNCVIEEE